MIEQPKVSILVPVYGVERYIERCTESLMEQTYEDIEYIFVDDATPDRSIEILEDVVARYPKRRSQVRILQHKNNKGISAARNTAVAAAVGMYMLHVDSDDYIAKEAIEKLVYAAQTSKADIVIFDTIELRKDGEVLLKAEYENRETYIKGLLQHTNRCAHWNKFYRTDFYKHTGIQSVENVRLGEDYAVTPRLVHQAKKISVLHEGLYYYETRNQSSYVHNLNRAAIESQHLADRVLVDYFRSVPDKAVWADVIDILPQRTVVSLVKRSGRESWEMIREIYSEELQLSGRGLKWLDRTIYRIFVQYRYATLTCLVKIYRWVFAILK
ncbi:MAG: glycosyltransferase family 2 protein [Bacteroidales bacterium]|nr:glycosyltransferase family 2 protein [Bacteroidales bacterium]